MKRERQRKLKEARKKLLRVIYADKIDKIKVLNKIKEALEEIGEPKVYVKMLSLQGAIKLNKDLKKIKKYLTDLKHEEGARQDLTGETKTKILELNKKVQEMSKANKHSHEYLRNLPGLMEQMKNEVKQDVKQKIEDIKFPEEIKVSNLDKIKPQPFTAEILQKALPKPGEMPKSVNMELNGNLWRSVTIYYPSQTIKVNIERVGTVISELTFSKE